MKYIFLFLLLCGSLSAQEDISALRNKPSGGGRTFTLLHQTFHSCTSCASDTITIPSTTAGSLIVINTVSISNQGDYISTTTVPTDGGDTFTVPAQTTGGTSGSSTCGYGADFSYSLSCAYTTSGAGGKTSLVVTFNTTAVFVTVVSEVSYTGSSLALDAQGCTRATTTNPSVDALTLTGSSDALFPSYGGPAAATAVSAPYSNFLGNLNTDANGFAIGLNLSSGTGTWTMGTAGDSGSCNIAFK